MIRTITKKKNETNLLCVKSMSEYQDTPPPAHHKNGRGKRKESGGGEKRVRESYREGGSRLVLQADITSLKHLLYSRNMSLDYKARIIKTNGCIPRGKNHITIYLNFMRGKMEL